MRAEKLNDIEELLEKAKTDPALVKQLQSDFMIQVTEMYRDPMLFRAIREQIIPILKTYPFIRIWHAGCSTGEEVYSMAILLYEEGLYDRCRIYATDISERALEQAKSGVYPHRKVADYSQNYSDAGGRSSLSEYYTAKYGSIIFRPFLKRNLIFSMHNLVTDFSFNEFHLVLCRNVLIYFTAGLQQQVHQLLYNSLTPLGFLALGLKESIKFAPISEYFTTLDSNAKLYRKIK